MGKMRALLSLCLAVLPFARAFADAPEKQWAEASAPFDGTASGKCTAAPPSCENKCGEAKRQLTVASKAEAAKPTFVAKPKGLGPATWDKKPSYGEGLLGGFLGLFIAPFLFAYEAIVGAIAFPYRMIKGLIDGDGWSLLEPLRTAKNLVQDAVMTAVGMLSSATAPVWNAIVPEKSTDFQFSNDRLKFVGGPMEAVVRAFKDCYGPWGSATTSWHTSFWSHKTFAANGVDRGGAGHPLEEHETVHSIQWKHSFLWEKQSHDFVGKDYSLAHESINW
jgi:hypothetical protein